MTLYPLHRVTLPTVSCFIRFYTQGVSDSRWSDPTNDDSRLGRGVSVTTVHERTQDYCPRGTEGDYDGRGDFVRRVLGYVNKFRL